MNFFAAYATSAFVVAVGLAVNCEPKLKEIYGENIYAGFYVVSFGISSFEQVIYVGSS